MTRAFAAIRRLVETRPVVVRMSIGELRDALAFAESTGAEMLDIEGTETGVCMRLDVFAKKWRSGWNRTGEHKDITDYDSI